MSVFRKIFFLKNLFLFVGVVQAIQAEIEARCLADGGWSSGKGTKASIETTCYALMALHERQTLARAAAIDLLMRTQNPDGSWSAFEGDDDGGC